MDLQKHFEKFGIVDHISVAKDKNGGEGHKGFAFVTFVDKQVSVELSHKNRIMFYSRSVPRENPESK